MAKKKSESVQSSERSTVAFEYIKSQLFRVIHADGAIGGITPAGNLHVAFYSERPAIPQMMVHQRSEEGILGEPIPEKTVKRAGMIREMDIDVVLSPSAVDGLIAWLVTRKAELAEHTTMSQKLAQKISASKQPSKKRH